MNMETMTALDDETGHDFDADLIPVAPFSPPSLSISQYKQLELLQHLTLYSELLILFSGEKGMGKTFIAQALIASREDPDQSLLVDADFSLEYLDILHRLAEYLDLPELEDASILERQIIEYCEHLQKEDQGSFLLVIDQADQLTNDVLLHLNQLALMQPSSLHVMMLATPILENVLVELPEPHAPLHVMQIETLADDEAEIILLEQFPEKEWSGEQVDYMLQQSKGSPGKLMYIAQRLFDGAGDSDTKEKAKFPLTHIAAMLLIASVLVVSFMYKDSEPALFDNEDVAIESVPEIEPAVDTTSLNSELGQVDSEEIDFNFIKPVEVATAKQSEANLAAGRRSIASPVTRSQDTMTAPASGNETDEISTAVNTAVTSGSEVERTEVKNRNVFSKAEQLLIEAKSTAFVVQLFGSHSQKSAQVFMQENRNNADQLLSYQASHQGKSWYVVVSGPFDSRAAATQSVGKLPAKLRKQQPWVRSIEPIQTVLKAR